MKLFPNILKVAFLAVPMVLSACSVTVPAVVKMEKGEIFMGSTTASIDKGRYSMTSVEGKTITGTYNSWDTSVSRTFDFTISDGRTGRVIVNAITYDSGYGIGKLSTGEKCKFMYGNSAVVMEF